MRRCLAAVPLLRSSFPGRRAMPNTRGKRQGGQPSWSPAVPGLRAAVRHAWFEARARRLTYCGGQHSSNTRPAPAGSNTRITRTKRHYPAHVGTPAKMASQAPVIRPIAGKAGCVAVLGRGSRAGDRPSVKRWVTSSTAIQMDHNGLGQRSPRSRSVTSVHIVISSNNYRSPNLRGWQLELPSRMGCARSITMARSTGRGPPVTSR